MKKRLSTDIFFLLLFLFLSCKSLENQKFRIIKIPESYKVLAQTEGDLDNDRVPEKVIVYETGKITDLGTERQIFIYKNKNSKWVLWKKSIGAVLPSEHGGVMGDPFEGISIERNSIVINHFGGSRQKWNYTHKFRYKNGDFQLIEANIYFGSPCDYFFTFDYNLITGRINYQKETENCENESLEVEKDQITSKLEFLPTMNGFYPGDNELKFPNSEIIIYY